MDPATVVIAVVVSLVGLWGLFSFGLPVPAPKPDEPALPLMVELGTLSLRAEIAMSAVEITLRQRHLHHEAEGARQMRAAVKELLEALKNEQQ